MPVGCCAKTIVLSCLVVRALGSIRQSSKPKRRKVSWPGHNVHTLVRALNIRWGNQYLQLERNNLLREHERQGMVKVKAGTGWAGDGTHELLPCTAGPGTQARRRTLTPSTLLRGTPASRGRRYFLFLQEQIKGIIITLRSSISHPVLLPFPNFLLQDHRFPTALATSCVKNWRN